MTIDKRRQNKKWFVTFVEKKEEENFCVGEEKNRKDEARLYVSVAGGRLISLSPYNNVERGSCDSGGATIAKAGKFKKWKKTFFYHWNHQRYGGKLPGFFYLFKKKIKKKKPKATGHFVQIEE